VTAQSRPVASLSQSESTIVSAISQFTCNIVDNRIVLTWENAENEQTDRFELERSKDGKRFSTAALVFGTDTPGIAGYKFHEKVFSGKVYYRIKIIRKDKSIEYSTVLQPNAKTSVAKN
jgi:hypothetical protein